LDLGFRGGKYAHREDIVKETLRSEEIRLVLTDVDGTLVDSKKRLTNRAKAAVEALKKRGILFAITSGRPPRGMKHLLEELRLDTPAAAFNGGMIITSDLKTLSEKILPEDVAKKVVQAILEQGYDAWIYRGQDWLVRDRNAPHVDQEMKTVQFEPEVVKDFDGKFDHVIKIVGVSDRKAELERSAHDLWKEFSPNVSAALSQPYYLDVTHPEANKGYVVKFLSDYFKISPNQIATLGDMPNDIDMFNQSGLSIAMGNGGSEVKQCATKVTDSLDNEGFAKAIENYILKAS
jgi:Cof subfamily protein (haloacid dehalogenase superfamily)